MITEYAIVIPTCKTEDEIADLIEEVKRTAQGNYQFFYSCQPLSAAQNRNICLNAVNANYIVMIDDDVTGFNNGWNIKLCEFLVGNITIVSARLMRNHKQLGAMSSDNYDVSKDYVYVPRVPTACVAFKKTPIRFNERYVGSGFEDTDFCKRLGGRILIDNRVRVIHKNEMKNQGGDYWEINKKIYESQWGDYTK
jgi:hypothetical protein